MLVPVNTASRRAAAPVGPPSGSAPDALDQLRKLAELRDAGILSSEEFEEGAEEAVARLLDAPQRKLPACSASAESGVPGRRDERDELLSLVVGEDDGAQHRRR